MKWMTTLCWPLLALLLLISGSNTIYAQSPDTVVHINTFNGTSGQTWTDSEAQGWTGFQVAQVYDPDPNFYPGDHFLGLKWYEVNKLGAWILSPPIDFGAFQTFNVDFSADGHGWLDIYIVDSLNMYHLLYQKLPDALGTLELLDISISIQDAYNFSPKYNSNMHGETRLFIDYINPNKNRIGRILDFNVTGEEGTVWLGNTTKLWFENEDWTNGHPTRRKIGLIPNGRPRYPWIYGDAEANILTVENQAYFVVRPQSTFTGYETLYLNGTFNLCIHSNSTGTGSFMDLGGISGSGTAYVEQWVSDEKWHYTSSPIANGLSKTYLSLYLIPFLEGHNDWGNYIVPLDVQLPVMQGFGVWSSATYPPMGDTTVWFGGPVNTGAQSINITNSHYSGNAQFDGWNLIGNPYACALSWDSSGWEKASTTGAVYLWDPVAQTYNVYLGGGVGIPEGTTGEIPSGQGFFVKAVSNGVFSVNNSARMHGQKGWLKNSLKNPIADLLYLSVDGNNYHDETIIRFVDGASGEYENNSDAYKLFSTEPEVAQLYSFSSDVSPMMLAINTLPALGGNVSLPLGFYYGTPGSYSIGPNSLLGFPANLNLVLEDVKEDSLIDLRLNPSYSFVADSGDSANRFVLHFMPVIFKGTLAYDGDTSRPISGVEISLEDSLLGVTYVQTTNVSGLITIANLPDGGYSISPQLDNLSWNGVNATDALVVARSFVGLENLSPMRSLAADVDQSGYVNSNDAMSIQKRFVGIDPDFAGGDWCTLESYIQINGNGHYSSLVPALCLGDVNGSNNNTKAQGKVTTLPYGKAVINDIGSTYISLFAGQSAKIGAISLAANLPEGMQVENVTIAGSNEEVYYRQNETHLSIAWIGLEGVNKNSSDPVIIIQAVFTKQPLSEIDILSGSEIASANGSVLKDFTFLIPGLLKDMRAPDLKMYPNPVKGNASIILNSPSETQCIFEVSDILGKRVLSWAQEIPEGENLRYTIDLSNLKAGQYILRSFPQENPGDIMSLMFIKQD